MLLDPIPIIRPGVKVFIRLEVYEDDGQLVCLIHTLSGEIKLGPRAWLRVVRDELGNIENVARRARCTEMRTEGRDWSVALSALGYVPWPQGEGFGLRKVL